MLSWKKVGVVIPTNFNKMYPNSPETPFVSCIVWVCNPTVIIGGVTEVVRWDTNNNCWFKPDMQGKWIFDSPSQITHFCDDINIPDQDCSFCEGKGVINKDQYSEILCIKCNGTGLNKTVEE